MSDYAKFEPESEQYLAAVWSVMRDASAGYERRQARMAQGVRIGRWGYLRKIREFLGNPEDPRRNYRQMREDLIEFAESFGLADKPPTIIQQQAAEEFSQ